MRNRNHRSYEPLMTRTERLDEIKREMASLEISRLQRRAAVLAGQHRIVEISESIDEALLNQERNLEKIKRLSLAR